MDSENVQIPGYQIIINDLFQELDIDERILSALNDMNMIKMTPIQAKCIPHLIEGKDVMGAAKTGSGKTLAFLVPLVQKVLSCNFDSKHGTAAIIMSPTRELSLQIFTVLEKLVIHTDLKTGLVVGGNNRDVEAKYLKQGVTILVATPGRLLDHLNNTKLFYFHRLQTLIIDEADRLMEQGFLEDMKAIVRKLPKKRQTVLFSATLKMNSTKLKSKMKKNLDEISEKKVSSKKKETLEEKVLTLAYLSLKENCICVDMSKIDLENTIETSGKDGNATVSQLKQGYVICDPSDRFKVLYSFLKRNAKKKIIVFMSTCMEVKYFHNLFKIINFPVLALHGQQAQSKRVSNFDNFNKKESGIILCTDVAARGLDVPNVDWVIQFDPPDKPEEYIHRVGRTARAGKKGQALLFIRPNEVEFLSLLAKKQVPLKRMEFEESNLLPLQDSFEKIVETNADLRALAKLAFTTLVKAYQSYNKNMFDISKLDLSSLAKNFGLKEAPQVHISGVTNVDKNKKTKKKRYGYNSDDDNYFVPSKQMKYE